MIFQFFTTYDVIRVPSFYYFNKYIKIIKWFLYFLKIFVKCVFKKIVRKCSNLFS